MWLELRFVFWKSSGKSVLTAHLEIPVSKWEHPARESEYVQICRSRINLQDKFLPSQIHRGYPVRAIVDCS